ncbi:MAG: RNA polymerase sigma factor [Beijerinckiaceae bacterium]
MSPPELTSDPARTVAQTIAQIARQDRGRLLAILIGRYRNFDLAEEVLQEALSSAHLHWGRSGLPSNPSAWLLTVASRKAIDRLRQQARDARMSADSILEMAGAADDPPEIADDRLRLIFTCCHPALEQKSRIALTLRTLGGLTTVEIARAFLDNETTMGQRLSRAKAKILNAGIPYAVPGPEEWDERLQSVLGVIYLIFNEGYFASTGETPLRQSLCDEAIYLARMLETLRANEPEVLGLLALMICTNARRRARFAGAGVVPLEAQNHMLWDMAQVRESEALLDRAMTKQAPGPYQIQAAIAALHCQEGKTDWHQIVLLYGSLLRFDANPVIQLNRAVALAEWGALPQALAELDKLAEPLLDYQPFHAARADLLAKAGEKEKAVAAYDQAIAMAMTKADTSFLINKRAVLLAP